MDYTTSKYDSQVRLHPNPDDPRNFPKEIFDYQTVRSEALNLGIKPSDTNLGRVRRAFEIYHAGNFTHLATFGDERIYSVKSQNIIDHLYTVLSNGKVQCDCPDFQKGHRCKHSITIEMFEEQESYDEALCDALDEYYGPMRDAGLVFPY